MTKQRKAVSLISGGLDSMLATRVLLDQGVHVEGINFFTGFCVEGHTHAIRSKDRKKQKRNNALWVAEELGIKLHIIDVIEEYIRPPRRCTGSQLQVPMDCSVEGARAPQREHARGGDPFGSKMHKRHRHPLHANIRSFAGTLSQK